MSSAIPLSEPIHSAPPVAGPAPRSAYASLAIAALIWSTNAILVKFLLLEIPEFAAAPMRITLAAATLAVVYTGRGGRLQLDRALWRKFLPVGFWGLGLSFFFFTVGLAHTSISHSVFVGSVSPLSILIFSRNEGRSRLSPLRLGALCLSLGGVLLLALDQQGGASPGWGGDLLLLAGIGCLTFYTIRSKELAKTYTSLQSNAYSFLAAALCLSPLLLFELSRFPWQQVSAFSWWCLLVSGTLGSAGAYLAYYYALRWVQPSQAAVVHYIGPPLGTGLGVLFFQEAMTPRFLLGAGLILTGVILAERR